MTNEKTLWGLRYSHAWGWRFTAERKVFDETANEWLEVYRKAEPGITFVVAEKKPSPPKKK